MHAVKKEKWLETSHRQHTQQIHLLASAEYEYANLSGLEYETVHGLFVDDQISGSFHFCEDWAMGVAGKSRRL